jgi:hypothetical protein
MWHKPRARADGDKTAPGLAEDRSHQTAGDPFAIRSTCPPVRRFRRSRSRANQLIANIEDTSFFGRMVITYHFDYCRVTTSDGDDACRRATTASRNSQTSTAVRAMNAPLPEFARPLILGPDKRLISARRYLGG